MPKPHTTAAEYWAARRERDKRVKRLAERPVTERYCFCGQTPLYVARCPKCGKPPYTD